MEAAGGQLEGCCEGGYIKYLQPLGQGRPPAALLSRGRRPRQLRSADVWPEPHSGPSGLQRAASGGWAAATCFSSRHSETPRDPVRTREIQRDPARFCFLREERSPPHLMRLPRSGRGTLGRMLRLGSALTSASSARSAPCRLPPQAPALGTGPGSG